LDLRRLADARPPSAAGHVRRGTGPAPESAMMWPVPDLSPPPPGPPRSAASDVPEVLWTPGPDALQRSRMAAYLRWLTDRRDRRFDGYDALWRWSVDDLGGF